MYKPCSCSFFTVLCWKVYTPAIHMSVKPTGEKIAQSRFLSPSHRTNHPTVALKWKWELDLFSQKIDVPPPLQTLKKMSNKPKPNQLLSMFKCISLPVWKQLVQWFRRYHAKKKMSCQYCRLCLWDLDQIQYASPHLWLLGHIKVHDILPSKENVSDLQEQPVSASMGLVL